MKRLLLIAVSCFFFTSLVDAVEGFADDLTKFLDQYCIQCHGPEKRKGDRRFDTLALPIADSASLIQIQDILDILNLGEMPPEEEETRPNVDELLTMVKGLTQTVEEHHELLTSTDRRTILRRLNSREYLNTIRDLLQINTLMFDPTRSFPPDDAVDHIDTLGSHLVTSGYLWDRYFEAADEIVEKVFSIEEKPEIQTWSFTDNFRELQGLDTVMEKLANYEYIALYDLPSSVQKAGAYGFIYDFLEGVPYDGYYQIRLLAEAKNRKHEHIRRISSTNPNLPHELGIVPGNVLVGEIGKTQHIEPILASFTLPDEQLEWCEAHVWLDAGHTPRFIFPNGTVNVRSAFRQTFAEIAPTLDVELENDYWNRRYVTLRYGGLPHIRIHEIEISGPHLESWPPKSHQALFSGGVFREASAETDLLSFTERAYRRPLSKSEAENVKQFYRSRLDSGSSSKVAFKDSLKRILCSPGFLYLQEPADEGGKLDDYALASRLSYFLWSSMPDEELQELAAENRLQHSSVLRNQIRRMLDDPKANSLVKNFVELVLTLKELGSQPPDDRAYRIYYERNLQKYMYEETLHFVEHLFTNNRPFTDLLDADYTFINEPLAELYGYEGIDGLEFRKVKVQDPLRRGVLGHGSILTLTANGVDTSPVIRGVWLLENILGSPPSPPPPDVEPFDPDTRGAVSLRDQLEKHRENPTCYDCHRKIDPLGFAFESFDAIGQVRFHYDNELPVESFGKLPDGASFETVAELKQILLQRSSQFARTLTTRFLELATGRKMERADRREIDRIVTELETRGNGMRDLVVLVAQSELLEQK